MVDTFTKAQRSAVMSRIRSKGNKTTELRFAILMRQNGIKGWRRGSVLPGKPDFVFRRRRIALFIDGDFWHGNPRKYRIPKSNCNYWQLKIEGNRARDRRINATLRRSGWKVVRIWESDLGKAKVIARKLAWLKDATCGTLPSRHKVA